MKRKAASLFSFFIAFLTRSKKTLLLIIIVAIATLALSATISIIFDRIGNLRFPSIGTIRAIGVEAYGLDLKTQDDAPYIDWGTVYLGIQVNRTFYVKSVSNMKTTMYLNTTGWNPPTISDYIIFHGTTAAHKSAPAK